MRLSVTAIALIEATLQLMNIKLTHEFHIGLSRYLIAKSVFFNPAVYTSFDHYDYWQ